MTPMRRRTLLRCLSLGIAGAALGCTASASGTPRSRIRRIGYLSRNKTAGIVPHIDVVKRTLAKLGEVEGHDFVIETRSSEGRIEPLAQLAADLIALPVDVIMVEATPAALAAQKATTSVPIVFGYVNGPVEQGIVASLSRPGANITGVTTQSGALSKKRLELLRAVAPNATVIATLWDSANAGQELVLRDTRDAARELGLTVRDYGVPGPDAPEFDLHLGAMTAQRPDAVMLLANMSSYLTRFTQFAVARGLPHIAAQGDDIASNGTLMGLGPDYTAQTVRAAALVHKILQGARPTELPVEELSQFLFVVNLATARRLGLTVRDDILRQATEVIP